jgi:hypothetical protein
MASLTVAIKVVDPPWSTCATAGRTRSPVHRRFDGQSVGRVGVVPSTGSDAGILSLGISAAATRRTPAPSLPPPPAGPTGERGVLMALPGRTSRPHGQNRISIDTSSEFPGQEGRAWIARLFRSGAGPEGHSFTVAMTVRRRSCPPVAESVRSPPPDPGALQSEWRPPRRNRNTISQL